LRGKRIGAALEEASRDYCSSIVSCGTRKLVSGLRKISAYTYVYGMSEDLYVTNPPLAVRLRDVEIMKSTETPTRTVPMWNPAISCSLTLVFSLFQEPLNWPSKLSKTCQKETPEIGVSRP